MTNLWNQPVTPEEEAGIAAFMERLAGAVPRHRSSLPNADAVWLKAQLLRRWDVERKLQLPLDIMEPVQLAAGLAMASLLLVWSLPSLLDALSSLAVQVSGN